MKSAGNPAVTIPSSRFKENVCRQPTGELSGGMKRRVSLPCTMHFQEMIILDEPFTGLDMKTRKNVIEYVLKNRRGRILLVATHGEEDAELLGGKIIRLEGCQDVKALQVEAAQKQIQREEILLQAENMVKQMDSTQLKRLVQMMKKMQENTLEANEQEALVSQLMGRKSPGHGRYSTGRVEQGAAPAFRKKQKL